MAVFTPVSEAQAKELLTHYTLGDLVSLRGIASGIENTNYFVTTTTGVYVLTLFERLTHEQLSFYIELMHHLAARGVAVPDPQSRTDGTRIGTVNGKPSSIVTCLRGASVMAPGPVHCAQVGEALARMHLAGADFPVVQPNLRGLPWWQETAPTLLPLLDAELAALLTDEMEVQTRVAAMPEARSLPTGPSHCDLFRDNVLFDGDTLGGFIDFYFAGCDTWLFDVAVTLNDWTSDPATGEIDMARYDALLQGYRRVRAFTDAEHALWPYALRAAALRFWISRLYDFHMPRPAQTLTPHDPRVFERILRLRRAADSFLLP
ncbi:homoserine kinase [Pigmentiphaga aceris]|uniref:Homoserine kinase n=1 Tax=Pigmentiphaga aceris TaxID=1940612 RepID=A0A5C0AY86_9BURK|nr:homoserine kinase [Pigmentiphaga aceris]QEI07348.1 homoserine kinase [Pigmentiphaga aceris]